jgi:hypothetical protein
VRRGIYELPCMDVPFSLGASLVEQPWTVRIPTSLVYLREDGSLPDFTGNAPSKVNPMDKPNPYEKLALLRMLTHSHAQADAYFETLGDAAALAANQVQDVRLEHLEKGPTVTAADVVLELFLAVALQYVGGKAVQVVTKEIMSRVLSSRRALLLIAGRSEFGEQVALAFRTAKMVRFVERGLDTPFVIADLATTVVFHTGRQIPQSQYRPRYTRLSPQDSPGVALLDNVSLFVVRQKTFNKIVFDDMVNIVLLDLLSRDDALGLIKELEAYATALYGSESLADIKQHYKLFFEACIWAHTLNPPPPFTGVPPVLDIGKRGKDLTEYLLARIVNPETEAPFAELIEELPRQLRRRSDEPTNQYFVLQSLLGYFRQLRTTIAEVEEALPAEGRTQWNYR